MRPSLSGVWCASATPLLSDHSIDQPTLEGHVRWLLDRGCNGVALFGSTGEGNSFTVTEREAAIDAIGGSGLPPDRLMVGAGACAYPDVIRLARTSLDAGIRMVLVHPPFYYRAATDDGLFGFFDRILQDVGSGELRLVLYHFPKLVGIGFSRELIGRLVRAHPQAIAGVKDSSGDLDRMAMLAESFPSFSVMTGSERLLLRALAAGAGGCLTATANLTSALAASVYRDRDADLQDDLTAYRLALEEIPVLAGIKHILASHTGHAGWTRIRPPLVPLDPDGISLMETTLGALGKLPNLTA